MKYTMLVTHYPLFADREGTYNRFAQLTQALVHFNWQTVLFCLLMIYKPLYSKGVRFSPAKTFLEFS